MGWRGKIKNKSKKSRYERYYRSLNVYISSADIYQYNESEYQALLKLFNVLLDKALADGFPIDYCPDNIPDSTPVLHYSLRRKSFDFTKVLLDKGANVNITDPDGNNVLMICCAALFSLGSSFDLGDDLFRQIAEQTTDVNKKISDPDLTEYSALGFLMHAHSMDNGQSVLTKIKILIDAGADIYKSGYVLDPVNPKDNELINHITQYQEQKAQLEALNNNLTYWEYEL